MKKVLVVILMGLTLAACKDSPEGQSCKRVGDVKVVDGDAYVCQKNRLGYLVWMQR